MVSEGIVETAMLPISSAATVETVEANVEAGGVVLITELTGCYRAYERLLRLNQSTGCSLLDTQPGLDPADAAL